MFNDQRLSWDQVTAMSSIYFMANCHHYVNAATESKRFLHVPALSSAQTWNYVSDATENEGNRWISQTTDQVMIDRLKIQTRPRPAP